MTGAIVAPVVPRYGLLSLVRQACDYTFATLERAPSAGDTLGARVMTDKGGTCRINHDIGHANPTVTVNTISRFRGPRTAQRMLSIPILVATYSMQRSTSLKLSPGLKARFRRWDVRQVEARSGRIARRP